MVSLNFLQNLNNMTVKQDMDFTHGTYFGIVPWSLRTFNHLMEWDGFSSAVNIHVRLCKSCNACVTHQKHSGQLAHISISSCVFCYDLLVGTPEPNNISSLFWLQQLPKHTSGVSQRLHTSRKQDALMAAARCVILNNYPLFTRV